MADITISHELGCDEDTYWEKCLFVPGDAYNARLFREVLKLPRYELLENSETPDSRRRKVRIDPDVSALPGPLRKVIGDRLSYVEEGTFDRKARRYRFSVTPSTLPDKTKVSGELYCEPAGEKKIRRIVKVHVEVKVMFVGSLVEDRIVSDLRSSYDVAATFTETWLREQGL